MINPGTPHVWVPVWAKKNWQSTRRERLAASWTSEVKIFDFVPLQGRYIKMVFSRPSVIEKNWLDLFSTPQTQKKSQFLNPNAGNCIFWKFQKNPILGWFSSLKPLCWPQFCPQRSTIWFPRLSMNWGRCHEPNQEHGKIWYHKCVNLTRQRLLSKTAMFCSIMTQALSGRGLTYKFTNTIGGHPITTYVKKKRKVGGQLKVNVWSCVSWVIN